ncbi:MAG TPA: DMT family transporter [Holophagaceae bacterium]|jgi:drug/metabolite transporter (DMT)-like permease|nr:DMT family transporter [Holophagaceae bacterium]
MPSAVLKRLPLPLTSVLVLAGFAANSLLCRAALGSGHADAASFTALRLASGVLALALLLRLEQGSWSLPRPRMGRAMALAAYMLGFSFAYRSLSAGSGALLLFGAVQVTMLGAARFRGEVFSAAKWTGAATAFVGLLVLTLPRADRPPLVAALSMAGAGAASGIYSLMGRASAQPLADTLGSFMGAALIAWLAFAIPVIHHMTGQGLALAVLSGSLASGAAYTLWYAILPRLGAVRAGVIQLAVPLITAGAGALFLGEIPGPGWFLAAALTLSGIALASRT